MDAALESKGHMGNEHGEELRSRDELVVSTEGRMVVSRVENATIRKILQARESHGGPFHVLKEGLELFALALGDAAGRVDVEARMSPRAESLDSLGRELCFLEWALVELNA